MLFASSLAVVAFAVAANAQTFTSCNPMNATCPQDPALGMSWNQTFSTDSAFDEDIWNITAGNQLISYGDNGTSFTINKSGDSVTTQTSFYIFWGSIEVRMKAALGQGIISSIVMQSDDLDEIDWEIMGGNGTTVETNYYGKGVVTQRNAVYYPCKPAPMDEFHNYNVTWSSEKIEWILDGTVIRTLTYTEAQKKDPFFPQTPTYIKLGIWAGGDKTEPPGVQSWAGGLTDYSKGPFEMTVESIKVTDGTNNATAYKYGDKSGTFKSIKTIALPAANGKGTQKSAQAAKISQGPPETMEERWNKLPQWARITIIATPLGVLALLILVGCFCCIKQRKLGLKERLIEDAAWEKNSADILAYRKQMASGVFGQGSAGYRPVAVSTPKGF